MKSKDVERKKELNRQHVARWRTAKKEKHEKLKQARMTVYACLHERLIDTVTSGDYKASIDGHVRRITAVTVLV